MTSLLHFSWPVDSLGYAIETEPPKTPMTIADGDGGPTAWLVANGGEPELRLPFAANTVLYKELAETEPSPSGVKRFAERHGTLDGRPRTRLDDWYYAIRGMRRTLDYAESGRHREFVRDWNASASRLGRLHLEFDLRAGTPVLRLVPDTLHHAIWVQLALHLGSAQQIRQCSMCPTWFTYGTGTGRRDSAFYCSPACRKAAYRARKAGAERR